LLVKVGCGHTIKHVNRLLGEISVFRNAEKRYAKICLESDIYSTKISYILNVYSTKFYCMQGRKEGGQGGTIPRAPNHNGGAESIRGRRKVTKMSQVIS